MRASDTQQGQLESQSTEIRERGFTIVRAAFDYSQATSVGEEIDAVLIAAESQGRDSTISAPSGVIVAARNVLEMYSPARTLWKVLPLLRVLSQTLGEKFGLVRCLYFDKSPERSWALPWHRDRTIAVQNNKLPSGQFTKATVKAGVQHIEAPRWLLENMLTLRIHLDPMTMENGPLEVVPGSHRTDDEMGTSGQEIETIQSSAGDVLAVRPLVLHRSIPSAPETTMHRRVLHLEFSGVKDLPDGYQWHTFMPVD